MGPDAFDFWLGEWDCLTSVGGAINSVTLEYDGKVIVERFRLHTPQEWSGMSLSSFNDHDGWRQTWVDQDSNYWTFHGILLDGDPCFTTTGKVDADQSYKRMVFSDITSDTLNWRWEISPDARAWTERMTAAYARKP
ncbi:hypothetical protein BH23ACT4_BH23ACT4_01530 [soil metagenome]